MTPARWGALAVLLLALLFALMGGEYSTPDWVELRAKERAEVERVAQLERSVDSLRALAESIETDPRVQERLARERFGMVRKGEVLYRLVEPDSGAGPRRD